MPENPIPYLPWEVDGKYFGDGREIALLQYIYNLPTLSELRGNPQRVLAEIDRFAREVCGLINLGEVKGKVITEVIDRHKPSVMIELGGYIGYSAILLGNALKQAGGKHYYSIEKDPLFAAIATSLIDLAGLRDTVRVIVGSGSDGVQRLVDENILDEADKPVGMIFLDHHKPSYTTDIKLCERLRLVGKGTVLVADNMTLPGNPPYAEYVRASVEEKRAGSTAIRSPEALGNPHLQYRSRNVNSYEPSGMEDSIEITECVGIEH